MSRDEQLSELLIQFGKMFSKASIIVDAIITGVNEAQFTCTVNIPIKQNGESVDNFYYNVPLKVLKGSQASFIEMPAKDSACTITFKDNNIQRPQLFQVNNCDKILMSVSDTTMEINTGKDSGGNDIAGIVFNGGKNGGMVLVNELKDQSNKDKQVLDTLLSIINGPPIAEAGNFSPSVLQQTLKLALVGTETGVWDNLENKKIQQ